MLQLATPSKYSWRALQIFSLYRLILAMSLFILFKFDFDISFLGEKKPQLYFNASVFYTCFSLLSLITAFFYQKFYYVQLESQVLIDILLIVLMLHASGGSTSDLGILIAVSTSAASILTGHPIALGFSVLASAAILGENFYTNLTSETTHSGIRQVSILSVTFMATSLLSFYLARRIIETEHVAEESMKGLENMEKLNNEIIQFMTTGVLVIDNNNAIRLINRSAWIYLGMPESTQSRRLDQVSTPLARQLNLWRMKLSYRSKIFKNTVTGPNLLPNFSGIGNDKKNVIIFLEDTTKINQQAQSLKLASLGRLTASIAHEIRNPLGALSHAAQLMKESDDIDPINLGLIEIIDKNTKRVNDIIENIIALSQRKSVQVKEINLVEYLPIMIQEYLTGKENKPIIHCQFQTEKILVHFDLSQLSQILTNLIDNAARYSEIKTGSPTLQITGGIEPHSHTAFLDVIDYGEGITQEIAEKLFEPFFTTSKTGTGLGLYLSKELCEVNRARLDYIPVPIGGACFRISFSIANFTQK